jgi:hypothetical protein
MAKVQSNWRGDGSLAFSETELGRVILPNCVYNVRHRLTIAQVNAGVTLLPPIAEFKYRMRRCRAIAIGGAAASVTTVDVLGTQSSAVVKLVTFAQASLTQSAVVRDGG